MLVCWWQITGKKLCSASTKVSTLGKANRINFFMKKDNTNWVDNGIPMHLSELKKRYLFQLNLMNDGSKERQQKFWCGTSPAENFCLILSFCGGAYPKYGMNWPKWGAWEAKY